MAAQIAGGTAHKMPPDLQKALAANQTALAAWQTLTPLARNEWICWTVSVKNAETQQNHIHRAITELSEGERRPCCWLGCIHRTDKSPSASQQYVTSKQARKSD